MVGSYDRYIDMIDRYDDRSDSAWDSGNSDNAHNLVYTRTLGSLKHSVQILYRTYIEFL
jgi:hypothetical protein